MTAYDELISLYPSLPKIVLMDIERRTEDWFSMGGHEDDQYIKRQLRYAKRVIRRMEEIKL